MVWTVQYGTEWWFLKTFGLATITHWSKRNKKKSNAHRDVLHPPRHFQPTRHKGRSVSFPDRLPSLLGRTQPAVRDLSKPLRRIPRPERSETEISMWLFPRYRARRIGYVPRHTSEVQKLQVILPCLTQAARRNSSCHHARRPSTSHVIGSPHFY